MIKLWHVNNEQLREGRDKCGGQNTGVQCLSLALHTHYSGLGFLFSHERWCLCVAKITI